MMLPISVYGNYLAMGQRLKEETEVSSDETDEEIDIHMLR